jgi:hypothetical protein
MNELCAYLHDRESDVCLLNTRTVQSAADEGGTTLDHELDAHVQKCGPVLADGLLFNGSRE